MVISNHKLCLQGEIGAISAYNPLDLFSGQTTRMQHALCCLIEERHRNMKVFVDGLPAEVAILESVCSRVLGPAVAKLLPELLANILQQSGE